MPSVILGLRRPHGTPLEDHPDNLQSLVARLVPDWAASEINNFQYLPGGYGNRNYRFDYRNANYVLRLSANTRPATDRNLERQFYAAPGSVAVAPLVAYDARSGNMISRWQKGTLLAETVPTPSSTEIARYVQNLHSGLPDSPRLYNPVVLARRYLATGNPDRRVAEIAGSLDWPPAPATTCHNDLNPWNVIRPPHGEWITLLGVAWPQRSPFRSGEPAPGTGSERWRSAATCHAISAGKRGPGEAGIVPDGLLAAGVRVGACGTRQRQQTGRNC